MTGPFLLTVAFATVLAGVSAYGLGCFHHTSPEIHLHQLGFELASRFLNYQASVVVVGLGTGWGWNDGLVPMERVHKRPPTAARDNRINVNFHGAEHESIQAGFLVCLFT